MKLQLRSDKNIEFLKVEGEITPRDVQVIRAGLTKVLGAGKNRIIVELMNAEQVPPEALREIAKLDLLARELSGRILLTGVNPGLRAQIAQFAHPPVIPCFESSEEAVRYLVEGEKKPEETPLAIQRPATDAKITTPSPEEAAQARAQYKEQILAQEKDALGVLRKKVEALEKENLVLHEKFVQLFIGRKVIPDEKTYQDKIENLEAQLQKYLLDQQQQTKGAGSKS